MKGELRLVPREGSQLAILRTIAHDEPLLAPFLGWAAALAGRGALPRRASELLALRAAWNCRSAYEWGHHVEYARSAGLSESEIALVTDDPNAPGWSTADRALLAAADELHERQQLISLPLEGLASGSEYVP